jgi:hypothetical protein
MSFEHTELTASWKINRLISRLLENPEINHHVYKITPLLYAIIVNH